MFGIKRFDKAKSNILAICLLSSITLPICATSAIASPDDNLPAQENQQLETSVPVPSFYVTVTLTDRARQHMESGNETIIIFATLLGETSPDAKVELDESGRVDLTSARHELSGSGRTTQFSNLAIASDTVNQLISRDYIVNINAGSGRQSSDDNVLSCDFFEGRMSDLQPGVTLRCGLLDEYSDNQFFAISNHSVSSSFLEP